MIKKISRQDAASAYERLRGHYWEYLRRSDDQWQETDLYLLQIQRVWDHIDSRDLVLMANWVSEASSYFERRGQWERKILWVGRVLDAAVRDDDLAWQDWCETELGTAYGSMGQPLIALQHFERALGLADRRGSATSRASILCNMSVILIALARYEEAVDLTTQGYEIFLADNDLDSQAFALNNRGEAKRELGDWNEALEDFEESARIADLLSKQDRQASSSLNIGEIYRQQGMFDEGLRYNKKALELYRVIGNQSSEATALNNIGEICRRMGDLDEAVSNYAAAKRVFEAIGHPDIAVVLNNLGLTYFAQGHHQAAIEVFEEARSRFVQLGEPYNEAVCLVNIGRVYLAMGNNEQTLKSYLASLRICQDIGHLSGQAEAHNNMGVFYRLSGQADEAVQHYGQALELYSQLGDEAGRARISNNMGEILREQGNLEEAENYLLEALRLYQELGHFEVAMALNNLGLLYRDKGKHSEGLEYLHLALSSYKQSQNRSGIVDTLDNIATVHRDRGEFDKAALLYKQIVNDGLDAVDIASQANILANFAAVRMRQGNIQAAIDLAQRALELAIQIHHPEEAVYRELLKRILQAQEDSAT